MSISHWGIFPGFRTGRSADLVSGLQPATWYRMDWENWCELYAGQPPERNPRW